MQIFVKLIKNVITYDVTESNDKGIYLKRYIADKLNFVDEDRIKIYDMRLMHAGRSIDDNDKISDKVVKDGTVHMIYKLPAGIKGDRTEQNNVIVGKDVIKISYSPKDLVLDIIKYILEVLIHQKKVSATLTVDDVHLKLGDVILDPFRHMAEYPKLARSFFSYNLQEDFINQESIFKPLINKFGDYYQIILLGERENTDDQLELFFEKAESNCNNYDCLCKESYNIILPCCRQRCCYKCLSTYTNLKKCSLCNQSI